MPRNVDIERSPYVSFEQRFQDRAECRKRQIAPRDRANPVGEIREVLIDRHRDDFRFLLLQPDQRALVVLIGRVEEVRARSDHRDTDQQREQRDVLGRKRRYPYAEPLSHRPAPAGSVKANVLPWPSSLSTHSRPPCNSTSRRESASPSPVPSGR
jgi:hypothetical protein